MAIEFQFPQLLSLILLIVPTIYFIHRGYALREAMLTRFRKENINTAVRTWLVSIVSFCILVSLLFIAAGPKRSLNASGENLTGSYVFMIDVSRSMAARQSCADLTRLDRAKNIISKAIADMPEAKIGFMGMAGLTFVLSEMSYDRQYIFDVLNHGIFIEVVPMPGTDLANAFHVFLEKKISNPPVFSSVEHIVLLSDGDISGQEERALNEVIPLLTEAEVKVTSVGLGSNEGVAIPTLDLDRQCISGQYERADGKEFYTHLNESPMKTVAENTEGRYFHESQDDELVLYLRDSLQNSTDSMPPQQTQDLRFPFILLLSLSLFCLFLIKRL